MLLDRKLDVLAITETHLKRLKVLPKKVLEAIYIWSIVPSATYGILVWGPCSPALLHNVERIHLRAAKIIYGAADVNLETLQFNCLQPLRYQPPFRTVRSRIAVTLSLFL